MNFFESLYIKVFVNIIVGRDNTVAYIESCSKKGVINSHEESFDTLRINEKMLSVIKKYTSETPFYYISFLDASSSQGAIPTCAKNRIAYYYDVSDSEYKCQDSKWINYTSKTDLYEVERHYREIGVDFIFSPFSVLAHFFKDKIDGQAAIYVLLQEDFISLAVFKESELLYAQRVGMKSDSAKEELDSVDAAMDMDVDLNLDDSIDLDNVSVTDEMDSLDDFGDIEDLDSLDDIDEFSETQDVEEEFYHEHEEESEQESDDFFNEDYQRFFLVQSAINSFYKDVRYQSEFLENIYIADAVGVTGELKRYFEEEMFMNAYVRRMSLGAEVSALARLEVLA